MQQRVQREERHHLGYQIGSNSRMEGNTSMSNGTGFDVTGSGNLCHSEHGAKQHSQQFRTWSRTQYCRHDRDGYRRTERGPIELQYPDS